MTPGLDTSPSRVWRNIRVITEWPGRPTLTDGPDPGAGPTEPVTRQPQAGRDRDGHGAKSDSESDSEGRRRTASRSDSPRWVANGRPARARNPHW
jgi:hypothetical protein